MIDIGDNTQEFEDTLELAIEERPKVSARASRVLSLIIEKHIPYNSVALRSRGTKILKKLNAYYKKYNNIDSNVISRLLIYF